MRAKYSPFHGVVTAVHPTYKLQPEARGLHGSPGLSVALILGRANSLHGMCPPNQKQTLNSHNVTRVGSNH